jgi:hypothetical protein
MTVQVSPLRTVSLPRQYRRRESFAAELEADAAVALGGQENLGIALDDLAFDDAGEVHRIDSLSDGG